MNKVFLVGNLTRDPELRQTNSGLASCQLTIAVNRPKNKDGVVQADYFTVQTWRAQAENCAKYLAKGRKVAVCGELRTRNYEKDGRKVYVTEVLANDVEFLTLRSQPSEPTEDYAPDASAAAPAHQPDANGFVQVNDDELPF